MSIPSYFILFLYTIYNIKQKKNVDNVLVLISRICQIIDVIALNSNEMKIIMHLLSEFSCLRSDPFTMFTSL